MAKVVRDSESATRGQERVQRRVRSAIERILEVAGRDTAAGRYAATLLEAAAEQLEAREVRGDLPPGEQEVWASVGAAHGSTSDLAQARARAGARFADLVSRSIVGDANLARELGVDPSRISQRLAERSLYAFESPAGRCFPRWQIAGGRPVPGLREILGHLDRGLHPLAVDHWFTTPNLDLEVEGRPVSPAEWLATGGAVEAVAQLADL